MMKKEEFLLLLDELIEAEPGTLTGTESLASMPRWDSLAVMGFMALADEHFGATLSAKQIAECKQVGDLITLLDSHVTL